MKLFDTPTLQGREAHIQHALNFSNTWNNAKVTIHEAIAEGDKVVLIWSFRAIRVTSDPTPGASLKEEHRWGGFTLLRFDNTGEVILEVGEESEPGPQERLETVRH